MIIHAVVRSKADKAISFDLHDDEERMVGYAEGRLSPSNELISVVNIFDPYKRQGLGYQSFLQVFEHLNGLDRIKVIIGAWSTGGEFAHLPNHRSTNLEIFLNLQKKGLTAESAARQTATGKWAELLGFTEVRIINQCTDQAEVGFLMPERPAH